MGLLNSQVVRLTIAGDTYYFEVEVDGSLGERYSAEQFHDLLLDEILADIVSEEYTIQPVRVQSIIERLTDPMERRILKDFYDFTLRTFER